MNSNERLKQRLGLMERQHIGSVRLGDSGIGVCLHKDTVASHGDSCAPYGLNHLGVAASDACGLVGTL